MLVADRNLPVVLAAIVFRPNRPRIRVAQVSLVDCPWARQRVIDYGHFVVEDIRISFVEMDSLLEDRLIVESQGQTGGIIGARSLEFAGLDFERVVAAVAVLVDPFVDDSPRRSARVVPASRVRR